MRRMFVLLVALFLIAQVEFVFAASDERNVFIIDKAGNVRYQYQTLFAARYGYYIEAQDLELLVPENATNLGFFDSNGRLTSRKISSEDGFDTHVVSIQAVEYDNPYVVGFTYDFSEYAVARYKENYFFEDSIYLDQDSQSEVYVCITESASKFVKPYDSTPEESTTRYPTSYTPIHIPDFIPLVPQIYKVMPATVGAANERHKTKEEQYGEVDVCPAGYSPNLIPDVNRGDTTDLKFYFSDSSAQVENYDLTLGRLRVTAPVVYKQVLARNIPLIEAALHSIESTLNLNPPLNYRLLFVGDNDQVLGDGELIASSDGVVYMAVTTLTASDQFVQLNILRALIDSAMLNTYGAETDTSWWTNGALTNLALIVMKENGLPTNKIQLILNDIKDTFKELTTNQIIEALKDEDDEVIITAGIVDEIDTYCPNHVIKLNKIAKNLRDLNFNDNELNNYVLYNLRDECSKDISEIFDKYRLVHDDVRAAVDKLRNLQEKFSRIKTKRKDILEINTINSNLGSAQANLNLGRVEEALQLLDLSENIYETKLSKMLAILEEYADAENKAEAIPIVFAIPGKLISSSKLDAAIGFIKTEQFDSARTAINKSVFWSNNAIVSSLILDAIMISLVVFGFRVYRKKQVKRGSNHNRGEN